MLLSVSHALPKSAAAAKAARARQQQQQQQRPARCRPRRAPSLAVAAAAAASSSSSSSARPKQTEEDASCLRHLVDVALPRAQQRLHPFHEADAALARLVSDPLLIPATAEPGGSSGGGNGGANSPAAAAAAVDDLAATRAACEAVDAAVDAALDRAYGREGSEEEDADAARLFLQRCLYRVNRLSYFFCGAPLAATYENERAPWLHALRERVERAWQTWEMGQMAEAALAGGEEEDDALLPPPPPPPAPDELRGGNSPSAAGEQLLSRYRALDAAAAERLLLSRLERDRYRPAAAAPSPISPDLAALRDRLTARGYAHLLAAGAHDGLTEASRQSRVCAGTGHPAASAVFRILVDEYGGGRLERKHSTYYAAAMRACGILAPLRPPGAAREKQQQQQQQVPPPVVDDAERWLDLVPWASLAAANHNFLLAERRRHVLRYCGALAAFELAGPWAYEAYAAAADRIERQRQRQRWRQREEEEEEGDQEEGGEKTPRPGALGGYWRLHVQEDARHGPQAVHEVALPLVRLYGDASAWEVALGYDQEGFFAARATAAVRRDIEACGGLA